MCTIKDRRYYKNAEFKNICRCSKKESKRVKGVQKGTEKGAFKALFWSLLTAWSIFMLQLAMERQEAIFKENTVLFLPYTINLMIKRRIDGYRWILSCSPEHGL
jgi:hypothetical protein